MDIFRCERRYNTKKKTREEILLKKRESERIRYQEMKSDPQKFQVMKEKEKLKYLRKKARGFRKDVKDMTSSEHEAMKKKWKEHSAKYRARKKYEQKHYQFFFKKKQLKL